jgi:hypothetical protein
MMAAPRSWWFCVWSRELVPPDDSVVVWGFEGTLNESIPDVG